MARPIRRRVTDYDDFSRAAGMKLGNLYEYTMVDYPAFKPREIKGKRWVVAAKDRNGNLKLIKSPNKEGTVAEFRKQRTAGDVTGETSVVYANIKGQLDEGAGWGVVWKGEDWIDLGFVDLENPVSTGLIVAIGNWWNGIMDAIAHPPWQIR